MRFVKGYFFLKGDLYFLHRLILFDLSLQRNVITEDINENIQVYHVSSNITNILEVFL